jgi:biotin-(acetyl-CoA carboxylase) ligase
VHINRGVAHQVRSHNVCAGCMVATSANKCQQCQTPRIRVSGQRLPFVQYIVCLSVVAALQEAFSQRLLTSAAPCEFPFRIKWPNDVYVLRPGAPALKVGGIICHSLTQAGVHNIVVGLGLNVDNDEPTTCVNSVLAELSRQKGMSSEMVTRAGILAATLNQLESFLAVRCKKRQCLMNLWLQHLLGLQSHVNPRRMGT